MSFNTVHTLTGCLLDVEASADILGWGRPPLLLLLQNRPSPPAGVEEPTARAPLKVDDLTFVER